MLEQGGGQGLLGDPVATSAASDDKIHVTSLGEHLALLNQVDPVVEADDDCYVHLHCHEVWAMEDGNYLLRFFRSRDV